MQDTTPIHSENSGENSPTNKTNPEEKETPENQTVPQKIMFKKPEIIIGPRKDKASKTQKPPKETDPSPESQKDEFISTEKKETNPQAEIVKVKEIPQVPYKEPSWGGKPNKEYKVEILKSGMILENIDLSEKSCWVIGRLPSCDISLAHPTISRFHAVLQYRKTGDEKNGEGLYVYDLGSTHGTFWNGNRLKPNMYVRVQGGHMLKFGCSQRKLVIMAPEDEEEESEMTVTELKEKRRQELEERKLLELKKKLEEEELERLAREKEESEGINWGMAEDAEEETDLSENPYAQSNNEDLFLDDPKKTLRGWFEREGCELQYQTEERGIGQFLCWVDLPIDSITGKSTRVEALVKGKKKESVIQCALEACRILDRHGLLRQSSHESRKRKNKNWEEDDFYDSDEDNFFDRTGAIEKKRQQRMQNAGKCSSTAETYDSLMEKYKDVTKLIADLEKKLQVAKEALDKNSDEDADALDAFMDNLSSNTWSKSDVKKLKIELSNVRKDEANLLKLINIAKPATLPALKPIESAKFSPVKPKTLKNVELDEEMKGLEEPSKEKSPKISEEKSDCEVEKETKIEVEPPKIEEKVEKPVKKLAKSPKKFKKQKEKTETAEKYEEEKQSEDYSTWVPPSNQTGDGRTNLNEKYGY